MEDLRDNVSEKSVAKFGELVLYPHPALLTRCDEVTYFGAELRELVDAMWDVMYRSRGIGLAANQIGVTKRVAVIDVDYTRNGSNQLVLANPVITKRVGNHWPNEGCLSVPEFREKRDRAVSIECRAQDIDGKQIRLRATWLLAQAIQHECDHLDGRLCLSESTLQQFLAAATDNQTTQEPMEMRRGGGE